MRLLPAAGLFLIAPLVAEFLLGNMPITMLGNMVILAPLYGGGALLIREVARRNGRGWPTILLLALSFGLAEEAFMTQSLFNPNYLGLNLHLLDPAYIPCLGIGAWWTSFVLTLHVVWSIAVSIGLAEALVPDVSTTPWLNRSGVGVVAVLFALAATALGRFSIASDPRHFVATSPQFLSAAVLCVGFVCAAFFFKPRGSRSAGHAPSPWLTAAMTLLAGSIFLLVPSRWGWWAVVAYFGLDVAVLTAVFLWSRCRDWGARHRLALAGGAALAYAWHAFVQVPVVGQSGMIVRIGNATFALGAVTLILVAARKNRAVELLSAGASPGGPCTSRR